MSRRRLECGCARLRQAGQGSVRHCLAGCGQAWQGKARHGPLWTRDHQIGGLQPRGGLGGVRPGKAWLCLAGRGGARHGKARSSLDQGASMAPPRPERGSRAARHGGARKCSAVHGTAGQGKAGKCGVLPGKGSMDQGSPQVSPSPRIAGPGRAAPGAARQCSATRGSARHGYLVDGRVCADGLCVAAIG